MSTRARKNEFWKTNAFWIVGIPTALIAVMFLLAMIASALGH